MAGRHYQLLSGHAAIGPYLKDKIHKAVDDKRWRCEGEKKQTGYQDRLPPLHGMQGLAPPDHKVVEGYREDVWVETPEAPLGQVAVERESHGAGSEIPEGHQGRMHQQQKGAPGGGMLWGQGG